MTPLLVLQEGPVRRLRLNRPEVRNALDEDLRRHLGDALRDLADDSETRVVVLEGDGPCFSAGANLRELAALSAAGLTWAERRRAPAAWQRLLDTLEALPQVTIAGVQGAAIGGGLLLALSCDLRVATSASRFSVPEVRLGFPLAWAGVPRLVREIGLPRARDLVLTGREVSAQEAHAIGLVTRLVPDGELDASVEALVSELLVASPGPLDVSKAAFAAAGKVTERVAWADPELFAGALEREPLRRV